VKRNVRAMGFLGGEKEGKTCLAEEGMLLVAFLVV